MVNAHVCGENVVVLPVLHEFIAAQPHSAASWQKARLLVVTKALPQGPVTRDWRILGRSQNIGQHLVGEWTDKFKATEVSRAIDQFETPV